MLKRFALIAFAIGLFAAFSSARLFAHEGHEHKVMGTVTMAAPDHLMLKDKDGMLNLYQLMLGSFLNLWKNQM